MINTWRKAFDHGTEFEWIFNNENSCFNLRLFVIFNAGTSLSLRNLNVYTSQLDMTYIGLKFKNSLKKKPNKHMFALWSKTLDKVKRLK